VGRSFDEAFLEDLPAEIDPCGEEGAFHTFVVDGPPFRAPVPVEVGEEHGDGRMRYVRLRPAAEAEEEEATEN
jgi:diphthamide synthase (EF-2-diphthine--ammonia ligase)